MKPIRLTIAGLHSFREPQEIHFDELSETGVFGIFGPTGSGKSTILDAMTLALYGTVGRAEHNTRGIMNHAENTLTVTLLFQIGHTGHGRTYRVERAYRRKDEVAVQNTRSRLIEVTGGVDVVLADKDSDVTHGVKDILGLEPEDFTRAVVLPQGKFAEFLNLRGAERNKMLERLFSLEKYGDGLNQRVKHEYDAADREHERIAAVQQGLGDASQEAVENAQTCLNAVQETERSLRDALQSSRMEHNRLKHAWELQQTLLRLEEEWDAHRAGRELQQDLQRRAELAVRAARVLPLIEAREQAEKALAGAALAEETSRVRADNLRKQAAVVEQALTAARTALQTQVPALSARQSRLEQGLLLESSLQRLQEEEQRGLQRWNEASTRQADAETEAKKLDVQIAELKPELERLREELKDNTLTAQQRVRLEALQQARSEFQLTVDQYTDADNTGREAKHRQTEFEQQVHQAESVVQAARTDVVRIQSELDERKAAAVARNLLPQRLARIEQIRSVIDRIQDKAARLQEQTTAKRIAKEACVQAQQAVQASKAAFEAGESAVRESRQQVQLRELEDKQWMAARLASELQEGEACPVCGSTHHPHKQAFASDHSRADADEACSPLQHAEADLAAYTEEHHLREVELATREANLRAENARLQEMQVEVDEWKKRLTSLDEALSGLDLPAAKVWLSTEETLAETESSRLNDWERAGELLQQQWSGARDRLSEAEAQAAAARARLESATRDVTRADVMAADARTARDQARMRLQTVLGECGGPENADTAGITWIEAVLQKAKRKDERFEALQQRVAECHKEFDTVNESRMTVAKQLPGLTKALQEAFSTLDHARAAKADVDTQLFELVGQQSVKEVLQSVRMELEKLQTDERKLAAEHTELAEAFAEAQSAWAESRSRHKMRSEELTQCLKALETKRLAEEFISVGAVLDAAMRPEELDELNGRIRAYEETERRLETQRKTILAAVGDIRVTPETWEQASLQLQALESEWKTAVEAVGAADRTLQELNLRHSQWMEWENNRLEAARRLYSLAQLKQLFSGNRFVEYIAQAQLEFVAKQASDRLKQLTRNRYALEVATDGRFVMRDDHNGGVKRPVTTLSGGETFLTSLALALSLSTQIQLRGQYPLEFFFLDEGFGTLDPELLEVVMSALEKLHMENMTIGVISHVPDLQQRMQRRLIVVPAEAAGSGTRVHVEQA